MQHRFAKAQRLLSKSDFAAMRRARRIRQGDLNITYRQNDFGRSRLGFAVSRKYGNAVQRNRLKRVIREAFRTCAGRDPGLDLLIVPAVSAERMQDGARDFIRGLSKISPGTGQTASA